MIVEIKERGKKKVNCFNCNSENILYFIDGKLSDIEVNEYRNKRKKHFKNNNRAKKKVLVKCNNCMQKMRVESKEIGEGKVTCPNCDSKNILHFFDGKISYTELKGYKNFQNEYSENKNGKESDVKEKSLIECCNCYQKIWIEPKEKGEKEITCPKCNIKNTIYFSNGEVLYTELKKIIAECDNCNQKMRLEVSNLKKVTINCPRCNRKNIIKFNNGEVSYINLKEEKAKLKDKIQMCHISLMTGRQFEYFLASLFRKKGYEVEITPESNDNGADLIIEKFGEKIAIQAKRYKNKVREKALEEIFAAKSFYKCDKAMVITNSNYTISAKKLANNLKIKLWDKQKLKTEIQKNPIDKNDLNFEVREKINKNDINKMNKKSFKKFIKKVFKKQKDINQFKEILNSKKIDLIMRDSQKKISNKG